MKIEYQVTSIEISKKLSELGVKQESLFHYTNGVLTYGSPFLKHHISAFTASEILEILPYYISYKNLPIVSLYIEKTKIGSTNNFVGYYVAYKSTNFVLGENYLHHFDLKSTANFFEKNLVDACAKMLIYVIENKILEFNK